MQCNQLPANCRISPMTSVTREAMWDSISIKSLQQYKTTHLWGVARQVFNEEAEVGKVPRGKGRALAKPNRWWDTETRMQEGGFPGIHTSLAFCWGAGWLPTLMYQLLWLLLTGTAGRHSAPSLVVAAPPRQQRIVVHRQQHLFVEILPKRQQREWNLNYCPCYPACPENTIPTDSSLSLAVCHQHHGFSDPDK